MQDRLKVGRLVHMNVEHNVYFTNIIKFFQFYFKINYII